MVQLLWQLPTENYTSVPLKKLKNNCEICTLPKQEKFNCVWDSMNTRLLSLK